MKRLGEFFLLLLTLISVSACSSSVEILLPAYMFDGSSFISIDVDELSEIYDLKNVSLNNDGSVTIKMTKNEHAKMLEKLEATIADTFNDRVTSAATAYIKDITYTEDFRMVSITVDKESYANTFDLTEIEAAMNATLYQNLKGLNCSCEIIVTDEGTGEIISSNTYEDYLFG